MEISEFNFHTVSVSYFLLFCTISCNQSINKYYILPTTTQNKKNSNRKKGNVSSDQSSKGFRVLHLLTTLTLLTTVTLFTLLTHKITHLITIPYIAYNTKLC